MTREPLNLTGYSIQDPVIQQISSIINKEQDFHLLFYTLNEKVEQRIEYSLGTILSTLDKLILQATLYTCIKELFTNCCKANYKRIFFEKNGLDINNEREYDRGMQEFKASYNSENINTFGSTAKAKGIWVQVSLFYSPNGMRIEVTNNTPILPVEERRIRDKLAVAMKYDNLVDFYNDNADETEGFGMGIALICIILRAEGINPEFFRIGIKEKITTARIEIPFNGNYVFIRKPRNLDIQQQVLAH